MDLWPTLDLGCVQGKVQLAPGVALVFSQLVLDGRCRAAPAFQAPGMDLLYAKRYNDNETLSLLILRNTMAPHKVCLPSAVAAASVASVQRPPEVPGNQTSHLMQPPDHCINSSSPDVPNMQRCWAMYGMYDDLAVYGTLDAVGEVYRADYIIWTVNSLYVCPTVMTFDCMRAGGVLPCYYKMYPRKQNSTVVSQQPETAAAMPPSSPDARIVASNTGSANGGGGDGGTSPSYLLAPLLGGLLGGFAFLAVVATVSIVALMQRRRKPAEPSRPIGRANGKEERTLDTNDNMDAASAGGLDAKPFTGIWLYEGRDSPPTAQTPSRSPEVTSLVPVTWLTPLHPDVKLSLDVAAEVQLTSTTLGAGTYGRVVRGIYGGIPVAVKLVRRGLAPREAKAVQVPAAVLPASAPDASSGTVFAAAGGADHASVAATAGGGGGVASEQQTAARATTLALDVPCTASTKAADLSYAYSNHGLLQEVEVLARCEHPNIVRLLAANVTHPHLCLVMELMDTSLDKMLYGDKDGCADIMPLPKVLHIAMQVANALAYLHPTIFHRDLKPANVLIQNPQSDTPVAKLADFGLSRLLNTVLVTKHPEVGTVPYMAPELFDLENNTITDRSDIYGLGVILYELLAGRRPWEGMALVQIAYAVKMQQMRPPLSELTNVRCPLKLRTLIHACWDPDPMRRPAAADVVKVLALVQEERQLLRQEQSSE